MNTESSSHPFYAEGDSSRKDVIRWWEARRLRYNTYVAFVGLISWVLVLVVGGAAVKSGEDFEEPIMMIVGPAIYLIGANLCYTFGWIVDVAAHRGRPRESLFKAGLGFSLVLTALPGIWAVVAFLITVVTGRKLE